VMLTVLCLLATFGVYCLIACGPNLVTLYKHRRAYLKKRDKIKEVESLCRGMCRWCRQKYQLGIEMGACKCGMHPIFVRWRHIKRDGTDIDCEASAFRGDPGGPVDEGHGSKASA